MASRLVPLAPILAAVALLPGCHAGGASGLSAKPAPTLPGVSLTATEAIERHNINASKIEALEARPRISVDSPGTKGVVDGRMALERPRNFKLELATTMRKSVVADIGSNDSEFWFWTESKQDRNVYVCSYEDLDRTPISAAFQPDWIIEAMGLRTISRDEAKQMASKQGDAYGTVKLVSTRRGKGDETLTKETILDQSGRIKEHRLYQGQGKDKVLIASAVIDQFKSYPVEGKDSVSLPSRFRLAWIPENLKLDIQLDTVTLVSGFSEEVRQVRFTEPDIPGTRKMNLAEMTPGRPTASSRRADPAATPAPRTRTSRAAPSTTNSAVRLGAPEPFGVDDSARAPRDPVALTADLPTPASDSSVDRAVRPALPRAVNQ